MKLSEISLIVYDFDGVMTNNKVLIDQNGHESVIVNRSDGLAISFFKKKGIPQIILSTEENRVIQRRAEKLQIECLQGIQDKKAELISYLKERKIDKKNVIYIGNDLNDYKVMQYVGLPIAPSDADWRIRKVAKIITKAKGGDGVIRELMDIIQNE